MGRAHTAERRNARTRQKAALMRLRDWVKNQERRVINMYRKPKPVVTDDTAERTMLLNRMTNWQRNQFMKACEGSPSRASTETFRRYAEMPHWKGNRHVESRA